MIAQDNAYHSLRQEIEDLPVIDCHEHTVGPRGAPEAREPIALLIHDYLRSDLISAGAEDVLSMLDDHAVPTEEKWPVFESYWCRTEHTGYARVTKRILKDVYAEEEMSLESLQRVREKLVDQRDPETYARILDEAKIRCRLVNILFDLYPWLDEKDILDLEYSLYPRDRYLISLPSFHMVQNRESIEDRASLAGCEVIHLDGFLEACWEIFSRFKDRGAVGFKDQSAYWRSLHFENPPRSEAERLFNWLMEDERRTLGWPEAKPLSDYLFQRFMEMAQALDLPVQLHTGCLDEYQGELRNDITNANAVKLIPTLQLHRQVNFALLHGNWPYAGEMLFLTKNYPNVVLDCSWLHIIDPIYAKNLLAEALVSVPHTKIHGFGGDYTDSVLHAVAHLSMARDVIASALADRIDSGWINRQQALQIAADWLFNNPNQFYKLGFEPVVV